MLFWMPWKSTASTLLYIILQALCTVWEAGTARLHHPSFQGCTSPEHGTAHSQILWPTFNPQAGRCLDGSICKFLLHLLKNFLLTKIPTRTVTGCLVKKSPAPSASRCTWGQSGFPGFAAHLANTFQEHVCNKAKS